MPHLRFRAWNKTTRVMIDSPKQTDPSPCIAMSGRLLLPSRPPDDRQRSRADFSVMEWTGWKDKSGKEIFEGDVIKHGDKNLEVVWNPDGVWDDRSETGFLHMLLGFANPGEVIRNIH